MKKIYFKIPQKKLPVKIFNTLFEENLGGGNINHSFFLPNYCRKAKTYNLPKDCLF